jgi:hypothetical protein
MSAFRRSRTAWISRGPSRSNAGHATEYVAGDYEVRDGIATVYVKQGERTVARIERSVGAIAEMANYNDDDKIDASDAWLHFARQSSLEGTGAAAVAVPSGPQSNLDVVLSACAMRLLLKGQTLSVTYEHPDHLGTVTAETDEEGVVTQRAAAYPYGTPTIRAGGRGGLGTGTPGWSAMSRRGCNCTARDGSIRELGGGRAPTPTLQS